MLLRESAANDNLFIFFLHLFFASQIYNNHACVHGSTNGIPISFKVLPMVPLVIPLVPMVMQMLPLALTMVPLVSQWYHWLPMDHWLPMVPLATNGTIGKITNGTIGRTQNRAHIKSNLIKDSVLLFFLQDTDFRLDSPH